MVCMVFPCFRAVFCLPAVVWFAGLKVSTDRSYVPGTWSIGYNNLINHCSGDSIWCNMCTTYTCILIEVAIRDNCTVVRSHFCFMLIILKIMLHSNSICCLLSYSTCTST